MALTIKDPETERLAHALAASTGESVTVAMRRALEERLRRVVEDPKANGEPLAEQLAASRRRFASLPILDPRGADDILGYGESSGLPD